MTDEDIELSVNWPGEDGEFVKALCAVGFLDGGSDERSIHDWDEHNPWASGAKSRSDRARFAAITKNYGRDEAARMMPDYAISLLKPANSKPLDINEQATASFEQCPVSASDTVSVSASDTVSVSASDTVSVSASDTSQERERDAGEKLQASATGICISLRRAGLVKVNPQHPNLLEALAEGVPARAITATVLEGKDAGKGEPFLWGIATARSRHAQGPKPIQGNSHAAHPVGRKLSAVEQVEQAIRDRGDTDDDGSSLPRLAG